MSAEERRRPDRGDDPAGPAGPRALAALLGAAPGRAGGHARRSGTRVSYLLLDPDRRFLVPPPHEVVRVGFLDPDNLEELLDALWLSARVAFLGLAIAIVIGIALAVVMSQARWVERSLFPYAVRPPDHPDPGLGAAVRVLVRLRLLQPGPGAWSCSLFPIVANTLFGLQSVEHEHHDLFTLHGAGRLTRLWKLQFPAALPSIFTGLRISAGLAVIGAIVGDFFFQQGDPGHRRS